MPPKPTLEEIRRFWNKNPIYFGEARADLGTRDFFEEHAAMTFHEFSGEIPSIYSRGVRAGTRVLDIGCGIGFWVDHFNRLGAHVTACDVAESAVELTRLRCRLFGLHADVRLGNAEELPYPDECFDHVNCQGVIHHTPDTIRCIQEMHRVLKPNGTACFSVYFKTVYLRSSLLYRTIAFLARSWVYLEGRGRESMLWATRPDELVRLYDGIENPLGKAYSRQDVNAMIHGWFNQLECVRQGLPRRALPISLPDTLHRFLSRRLGLMIVCLAVKSPCGAGQAGCR